MPSACSPGSGADGGPRLSELAVREYHYVVDRDGRVFHDGTEIVDPPTLRFFLLGMTRTPEGHWLVVCQGERNWFRADGTPFVVQRLRPIREAEEVTGIELELAGGHRERLDAATLTIEGEHLACRVRRGAFAARFGRLAMQQLAPLLEEDPGGLRLRLGGITRQIPLTDAASGSAPPRVAFG